METPSNQPPEMPEAERRQRIRTLNDVLRTMPCGTVTLVGGHVVMTSGIQDLGPEAVAGILHAVQTFDAFTPDNDPYGEHDFGSLEYGGRKLFWKIDYYDPTLTWGSENPADPKATTRVLTIMLAEEY